MEENLQQDKLSSFSFASRKLPEYMCHHLVRCSRCDVVYADRPPSQGELAQAYHTADYDSSEEANDAAASYAAAIRPVLAQLPQRGSALEIGTGTGIFLEHLGQEGFSDLAGVEPSTAAVASAPAHRRAWIREAMFVEDDYAPRSFDLICCFMTMEHVRDPLEIARSASRLLRPGGAFVTVTHDYHSWVNKLLGKRSPIIDVEHLQLFSQASLQHLFTGAGFTRFGARPFVNRYSLRYWTRLAPLPSGPKAQLSKVLDATGIGRSRLGVNVGNTIAHGFVPG
ncbi:class I SAM-dependent methyltransferase [Ramlibacter humi]|uniref:Class I SAM-dependent methyltransferase n=2 Tax=Ramlibacter humi TaxID=2530451 RepID=A0A4Z0BS52_9BURK|nr:class I SAM-dependent methyltransferase [Ramlibacter humi]